MSSKTYDFVPIKSVIREVFDKDKSDNYIKGLSIAYADVKDIYEYGKEHGKVFFRSIKDFKVHEIPVNWGDIVPKENSTVSNFPTSLF